MRPVAAIKGLVIQPVHTSLSMLDAKAAFTAAQRTPESGDAASARAVVELSEFQTALALCGAIKYEEVEGMSLAQRVAGIVANFLGEKDEVAVVHEVLVSKMANPDPNPDPTPNPSPHLHPHPHPNRKPHPHPSPLPNTNPHPDEALVTKMERHDPFKAFPPTGLTPKQHRYFLDEVWAKMDLGHLCGFPLWEKAVFMLLHRSFPELHSIFVTYSKRDDSGSATALETMQQTELVDLALDCGLATAAFPMARVQLVFARADLVDAGKAGDHGMALDFHEFLEAVVQLSFSRANPTHGEAGHENDAPAHPLPGCLEQMLHKNLMPIATRERLWTWREAILHEATVQVVLCLGLG